MNLEIPPGLTDLLQEFTVSVLRERPGDLVQFAAEYFNKLNERRLNEKPLPPRGVRFEAPTPPPDEPMHTDDEDDEPMPGMYRNICGWNWRSDACKRWKGSRY